MKYYKYKSYNYVTVVEIPKTEVKKVDFDMCKQPRETLDSYYKRQKEKPDVLINAGFFNMSDGSTVMTVLNEKVVYSSDNAVRQGIGIIGDKDVYFGRYEDKSWRDFMSAYPPLLIDGKDAKSTLAQEVNHKGRKTVFGFNDSTYFVICVDNPGMNFSQLKSLCLGLGIKTAVNFDGGGSTRLLINGVRKTSLQSNRAVDSVMAFYLQHNEKKVNYFVNITAKALNVRSGPNTNYSVVKTLKDKTTTHNIVAESYDSKWGKLSTGEGWISLSYTKKVNQSSSSENKNNSYKGKITTLVLNVRSGPGTNYKKVGIKRLNNVVTITSESKGWGKIPEGWISLNYVKKI